MLKVTNLHNRIGFIFSLETVPILDIHGLTLLHEFYTNQDISLNMKTTFSKLKLLLTGEFDVIFISILTHNSLQQV